MFTFESLTAKSWQRALHSFTMNHIKSIPLVTFTRCSVNCLWMLRNLAQWFFHQLHHQVPPSLSIEPMDLELRLILSETLAVKSYSIPLSNPVPQITTDKVIGSWNEWYSSVETRCGISMTHRMTSCRL